MMKRIILIFALLVAGFASMAQNPDLRGLTGLEHIDATEIVVDNVIVIVGDSMRATTQVSLEDDTLATKAYVDAGGAAGVTVLDFDPLTGEASIKLENLTLVDTANMDGRYGYLTTDTLIIENDSLKLGNGNGVPLSAFGVDSIRNTFDIATGDFTSEIYSAGVLIDTDVINMDGRYLKIADSTLYVTTTKLSDTLAYYELQNNSANIYTITLPVSGTLFGSITAAVEGTDYPTGWVLTANGENLEITHNLGQYVANVNVLWNNSGTNYRSLVPYQSAYDTFDTDLNDATIVSLSQYFTGYKLKVLIIFD